MLAALDQALRLEPLEHLAGRRARDAEHLRDAHRDRRQPLGHRAGTRRSGRPGSRSSRGTRRRNVPAAPRRHHSTRVARLTVGPSAPRGEQIDERRGDEDQQERGRGGPRVRAERRVLPDLRRQRLEADRAQEQGRGQLLHRVQEDERGAGEQPAADQRDRDRGEDAQRPAAEASRGLLDPRVHGLQRRLDAGERLREEADDVREDEQRKRLVERRQVVRGEEDERERDHDPRQRVAGEREPLERACPARRIALGEERDRQHRDDRDHRGERGDGNGRERLLPRDVDPAAQLEPARPSSRRAPPAARRGRTPTAAPQNANAGQRHRPSGIVFGGRAAPLADARTRRRERPSSTSSTAASATSTSARTAAGVRSKSERYCR